MCVYIYIIYIQKKRVAELFSVKGNNTFYSVLTMLELSSIFLFGPHSHKRTRGHPSLGSFASSVKSVFIAC